jgi:hypothetical protein
MCYPRSVITIYRRHQEACKYTSRRNRRCRCPIWAEGTVHGQNIRKSLDLRDWEAAVKLIRDWEVNKPESTLMVREAVARFIADAKARNLSEGSILKYEQSVKAVKEMLGEKTLRQVTVDDIRAVRESWDRLHRMQRRQLFAWIEYGYLLSLDLIHGNGIELEVVHDIIDIRNVHCVSRSLIDTARATLHLACKVDRERRIIRSLSQRDTQHRDRDCQ